MGDPLYSRGYFSDRLRRNRKAERKRDHVPLVPAKSFVTARSSWP
jgi:hypothetical protein